MMKKSVSLNNLIDRIVLLICFAVSYWLCRFAFFDIHGMKQFPNLLAIIGVIVLLIALYSKMQCLAITTVLGYILGFGIGAILNNNGLDAGGGGTNNFWIIWTVSFLICIIIGFALDIFKKNISAKSKI